MYVIMIEFSQKLQVLNWAENAGSIEDHSIWAKTEDFKQKERNIWHEGHLLPDSTCCEIDASKRWCSNKTSILMKIILKITYM